MPEGPSKPRPGLVIAAIGFVLLGVAIFAVSRKPRVPDLEPPAVVAQIQQLNQLATVKYTVQKVVGIREDKVPVGSESILLILQANVQAGVDLAGIRLDDISVHSDGSVDVRLPEAKLLSVAVDDKETKVWDRQKTWWTPWVPYSLDLEQRARLAGLEAVKKAALDMGILAQADHNAESSVRGLLGLAGLKPVQFSKRGPSL
jgi:hypothetical protein